MNDPTGRSARDEILRWMQENHVDPGMRFFEFKDAVQAHVNELIDAYAHELAEKIRQGDHSPNVVDGAYWAADLIDPETRR